MTIYKNFSQFFKLFRHAFGVYKFRLALVALLSFIGSLLEAIGINSIIPLFSFINRGTSNSADFISNAIERFFHFFNLGFTLRTLLLFIIALFIIKAVIVFLATYIGAAVYVNYEKNTRSRLMQLTLGATWPYLSKQKIGHLEQILTNDVNYSSNLLSYVNSVIIIGANLLVYILISINISAVIAILTLILGALIFLLFKPFFYKNKEVSSNIEHAYKQLAHYVNENMLGIKTVKSMGAERYIEKKGEESFFRIKNLNLKITAIKNFTNALLQPIGLIFIIGIFSFFYKLTAFNFASFAVIVYAINKIFSFIQQAQAQLHGISTLTPYVLSIEQYKRTMLENQESQTGIKKFSFHKTLEFKNINFTYGADTPTLQNLSFSITKGEMIGLVGPSGAGKTTIVDLLLRLFEPLSGQILIDGQSITTIALSAWREQLGYVSQDMFLINDTIENNIRFYDETLTMKDITKAAKMAHIDEFVTKQSLGFGTIVGERGLRLSGGERQRIILARVLVRKPTILILDEATSALDNESEAFIQEAIRGLRGNITVIAIAHRLSTVMEADRLLIIENGKINEQGKPHDLLKDKDSYFFKAYNVKV